MLSRRELMVSGTRAEAKEMEKCGQTGDRFGDRPDRAYWWFRWERGEVNKRRNED